MVASVVVATFATLSARPPSQMQSLAMDVHESSWHQLHLTGAPTPTLQQMVDLANALASGSSLPPEWQKNGHLGHVEASLSGLIEPGTGNAHVTIQAVDDSIDMDFAEIYVDGQLAVHADRVNGMVKDRSGFAVLTASFFTPPSYPFSVRLDWIAEDGSRRSQRHAYQ